MGGGGGGIYEGLGGALREGRLGGGGVQVGQIGVVGGDPRGGDLGCLEGGGGASSPYLLLPSL